jgi:hypothetical protein
MTKAKPQLQPLQVGDRVRVYDGPLRLIGAKGTISNVCGHNDLYHVTLDHPTPEADTPLIHFRQCVRLKKKPRPPKEERVEFWAEVDDKGRGVAFYHGSSAKVHCAEGITLPSNNRPIHLIELREGEAILDRTALLDLIGDTLNEDPGLLVGTIEKWKELLTRLRKEVR